MPIETSSNAARQGFNDQVRAYAQANGKVLFDIADVEAYNAAGQKRTDIYGREIMWPEWTSDGGHLSSAGAAARGERLVVAHGSPRGLGPQRAAGHLDQPGQRPGRRRHHGDRSRLRLRRGGHGHGRRRGGDRRRRGRIDQPDRRDRRARDRPRRRDGHDPGPPVGDTRPGLLLRPAPDADGLLHARALPPRGHARRAGPRPRRLRAPCLRDHRGCLRRAGHGDRRWPSTSP